jgi:hypothetical protein
VRIAIRREESYDVGRYYSSPKGHLARARTITWTGRYGGSFPASNLPNQHLKESLNQPSGQAALHGMDQPHARSFMSWMHAFEDRFVCGRLLLFNALYP